MTHEGSRDRHCLPADDDSINRVCFWMEKKKEAKMLPINLLCYSACTVKYANVTECVYIGIYICELVYRSLIKQ